MQHINGQVTKISTTADQCVRITVDIDEAAIPENINLIRWKNETVILSLPGTDGISSPEAFQDSKSGTRIDDQV